MADKRRLLIFGLGGLLVLSILANCWQFIANLNSASDYPTAVNPFEAPLGNERATLAQSGMIWMQRQEYTSALGAMEQLRETAPAQAAELQINWLQWLYGQMEGDDFASVQGALDVLLDAYPYHQDYLLLQADLYERSGRVQMAADAFYDLADQPSLSGDDVPLLANARRLALQVLVQAKQTQDWESALAYVDGLLWREPDFTPYILAKVEALVEMGDWSQAQLHLDRVPADPVYQLEMDKLSVRIRRDQQPASTQLALASHNNHFLVSLGIGQSQSVNLMIDTGASLSVISDRQLGRLAGAEYLRTVTMNTAGGQVQSEVYRVAQVQLGPYRLSQVEFAVLSLDNLAGDGLLGMNILQQFRFSIDTQNKWLELSPKALAP